MSALADFLDRNVVPRAVAVPWPQGLAASIAGPLLAALAFPNFNLGLFACIALVPLFWLWSKSSWKQALWWGWLAGTLYFLILFYWMTHSIGDFVGAWSLLALVLLCAIEGLSIAGTAIVTSFVGRGEFRTAAVFAAPSAWLLFESWRTRGELGVPFAELGLAAVHVKWLLPLFAYGGVYLLTFAIALCNAAITGLIAGAPQTKKASLGVLAVLAVLAFAGNAYAQRVTIPSPHLRVAIAQGNISQREKWSQAIFLKTLSTYEALTREAAARGARVVIWPETVVTSWPLQDPALLQVLENTASRSRVWILTGTLDRPAPNDYYNAMLDLTPNGSIGGVYRKRWLVPFAEYLPLDQWLRAIPIMDNVSHFLRGPGPRLLSADGYRFGILICYESAFAPYARATANAGADAIVIATDDAWFGGTTGPAQHADIAVVEAVSTGRWIVRGADTGISSIISPKGDAIVSLPIDRQGILTALIGRGAVTPYDRLGIAWLLALSALFVLAGLIHSRSAAPGWRSRRGRS